MHKVKLIRGTSKITSDQWCEAFKPGNVLLTDNLEELMQSLNLELQQVLDTLAQEQEKRSHLKLSNHGMTRS